MPLHSDFQKILKGMIDKYGKEKGKQVFYAWVNKHKLNDTKPISGQKAKLMKSWL